MHLKGTPCFRQIQNIFTVGTIILVDTIYYVRIRQGSYDIFRALIAISKLEY